jgi:hypothetical protein
MLSAFLRGGTFVERAGQLSTAAATWLVALVNALNQAPLRKQIASAAAQTAAIATTAIGLGDPVPAGYYRVSVYLRLTRAATTSSSVAPTIAWTEDGQARSKSGTAYTGNAIDTCADPLSLVIKVDRDTAISYAVGYASVGATAAQYAVAVVVEKLPEMPA